MLLVALGQGFSTNKKTTELVIYLKTLLLFTTKICAAVLFICATDTTVIYMRRSRPRGCQEEGGQRDDAKPQKGIEEEK